MGWGFESEIFAEVIHPKVRGLAKRFVDYPTENGGDDILIYHYSVGGIISEYLYKMPNRLVLIYHNMTPAKYFYGVNDELVNRTLEGWRRLVQLSKRCTIAVGDSEFNRKDLEHLGFDDTDVLPIKVQPVTSRVAPNPTIIRMFAGRGPNIIFVGRITPNKKQEDLLEVFYYLKRQYHPNARLFVVGDHGPFKPYYYKLLSLKEKYSLSDVYFTGHISDGDLAAYYQLADVFLCLSEHEGFCVPLIEAFQADIPVIAYLAGAIPETMGNAGIRLTIKNPPEIAGLVSKLCTDEKLSQEVIKTQRQRLVQLEDYDFESKLKKIIDEALDANKPDVARLARW